MPRAAIVSASEQTTIATAGFGRQWRLQTAAQYAEVFAARRGLRGEHFVLHYRPNGLPGPRLGLVIPKKQARRAVLRNAIKRQAREVFRQRRASLPAVDMVVRLARPISKAAPTAGAAEARAAWCAETIALFDQLCRKALV